MFFFEPYIELLTVHFSIYNIKKSDYFQKIENIIVEKYIDYGINYIWWRDKINQVPYYRLSGYGSCQPSIKKNDKYYYSKYKKNEIAISNSLEDLEKIIDLKIIKPRLIKVLLLEGYEFNIDLLPKEFNQYLSKTFPRLEILKIETRFLYFTDDDLEYNFNNFPKTIKYFYLEITDQNRNNFSDVEFNIEDTNLEYLCFWAGTFSDKNIKLNTKIKKMEIYDCEYVYHTTKFQNFLKQFKDFKIEKINIHKIILNKTLYSK